MNDRGKSSPLRMHLNYERLAQIACNSHAAGRASSGISESDISLARLYSYAFRGQAIGSFHAVRHALEAVRITDRFARAQLCRANESLADLANRAMDTVGSDMRALVSTFHFYSTHISRTITALDAACEAERNSEVQRIRDCFVHNMEKITCGNGLYLTQDTGVPELGGFVVPNLGIIIVPLVYGDHHSWNLAWLDGLRPEVPYHLHSEGVEIHLGFSPMRGHTVLGEARAEVTEGYAMPIPANMRHGYTNVGSRPHHVPFIFGSFTHGGWGIFFDVELQPRSLDQLEAVPILNDKFNGSVLLEREMDKLAQKDSCTRYPIIPAERTDRKNLGGLELSISRVTPEGIKLCLERFCTASVVRGKGNLTMAGQQVEIGTHDHFGIPAGLTATITGTETEPLVLLDAVLRPVHPNHA